MAMMNHLLGIAVMLAAIALLGQCCGWTQDNVKYENEKMYVNGKPFLYWGFIWSPQPLETLQHYRFNARLGRQEPAEFDRAAELGIHLMAPHGNSESTPDPWLAQHPATIAWFMMDDARSQEQADEVRAIISQIRKVDPVRPTLVDLDGGKIESDLRFVDIIDIYAPYAYPLPDHYYPPGRYKGYRWYFYEFLDHLRHGVGRKYMWSAFQCSGIYSFHARDGYTWEDQLNYPTPDQFRLLCWGAMAHGVRGFMFWPDIGLLPPNNDVGDRVAEAMIIAHELEIIGDEIVAGDEVRDGAYCTCEDVDISRIDLPDHTILIVSILREGYEYAIDEALAEVTISLPRPPQLEGDLCAYSFGFPGVEDLPLRQYGDKLIVGPHVAEVCGVIVIEEAGTCRAQHTEQLAEHLPAAAAAAQSLLNYLHPKMDCVHRQLVDLSVDLPVAHARHEKAVMLKHESASLFAEGRYGEYEGAIRVISDNQPFASVPVKLRVCNFTLPVLQGQIAPNPGSEQLTQQLHGPVRHIE